MNSVRNYVVEQSKGANKLTFKNTVILSAIGSLFVFLVICYPVVGSPTSETVSVSTDPIDLARARNRAKPR